MNWLNFELTMLTYADMESVRVFALLKVYFLTRAIHCSHTEIKIHLFQPHASVKLSHVRGTNGPLARCDKKNPRKLKPPFAPAIEPTL